MYTSHQIASFSSDFRCLRSPAELLFAVLEVAPVAIQSTIDPSLNPVTRSGIFVRF